MIRNKYSHVDLATVTITCIYNTRNVHSLIKQYVNTTHTYKIVS